MSQSELGFGVGFRSQHFEDLLSPPARVDWLEVISDNLMTKGNRFFSKVEQLAELYPLALHGVGLSIGGADDIDQNYLSKLVHLAKIFKPAILSDHLCWSQYQGKSFYDLLPLPYTKAELDRISNRLKRVQDAVGQRFYLENPSAYLSFGGNQMSESEFLAQLSHDSGCGLLLDVNNLFVNHCNLGIDIGSYLSNIQNIPICYLHLSGHSDCQDIIIDTHDKTVAPGVWELLGMVVEKIPLRNCLLEWDAHIPEFTELCSELDKARTIIEHSSASIIGKNNISNPKVENHFDAHQPAPDAEWQEPLANMIEALDKVPDAPPWTHGEQRVRFQRGIEAYRNNFRAFMIEILSEAYSHLESYLGQECFLSVCHHFIEISPRYNDIIEAVLELPNHLTDLYNDLPKNKIETACTLAKFEATLYRLNQFTPPSTPIKPESLASIQQEQWFDMKVKFCQTITIEPLTQVIHPLLDALQEGRPLIEPQNKACWYRFFLKEDSVQYDLISEDEFLFFRGLCEEKSFADSIEEAFPDTDAASITQAVNYLVQWMRDDQVIGLQPE